MIKFTLKEGNDEWVRAAFWRASHKFCFKICASRGICTPNDCSRQLPCPVTILPKISLRSACAVGASIAERSAAPKLECCYLQLALRSVKLLQNGDGVNWCTRLPKPVPSRGFEPLTLTGLRPKRSAYSNSATRARALAGRSAVPIISRILDGQAIGISPYPHK